MVGFKDHMTQFKDVYLSEDHSHMLVNDMWVNFKTGYVEAVEMFIPSKMTKTKILCAMNQCNNQLACKKRNKLYLRARKFKNPDVKIHYKRFRAYEQKVLRDAFWKYVSNIFTFENDSSDPDTPKPEKIKKFWSFIKSLKKDTFGITSLRENRILKTDAKEKANICNRQFQSPFTPKGNYDTPSKRASSFSSMGDITVGPKGVTKLLEGLKVHKAPGWDGLNARVLKECSNEISPILALILSESLARGDVPLPDKWRQANVSPVFKKGEKYDAANYRLVSLTCICCKTLEHILVSNTNKHLALDCILADCQHGFRSQRSCETQLVQFVHNIISNLDGAVNRGHKDTFEHNRFCKGL